MVENIIEDCINDFFQHSILKYRNSWKSPLYFTGSVAYEFRDIIESLCDQYELELGKIEPSPLDGLVKYYKEQVK
jgi:glucosamine kinase